MALAAAPLPISVTRPRRGRRKARVTRAIGSKERHAGVGARRVGPVKTPDERYLVVEGKAGPRLWRAANPGLTDDVRNLWVSRLMDARRALKTVGINP